MCVHLSLVGPLHTHIHTRYSNNLIFIHLTFITLLFQPYSIITLFKLVVSSFVWFHPSFHDIHQCSEFYFCLFRFLMHHMPFSFFAGQNNFANQIRLCSDFHPFSTFIHATVSNQIKEEDNCCTLKHPSYTLFTYHTHFTIMSMINTLPHTNTLCTIFLKSMLQTASTFVKSTFTPHCPKITPVKGSD